VHGISTAIRHRRRAVTELRYVRRPPRPLVDTRGTDYHTCIVSEPLGYLITCRTYGTWLHGDARGSVDRDHNVYGTPMRDPNSALQQAE